MVADHAHRRRAGDDSVGWQSEERMVIARPFKRTCRQFRDGSYLPHGNTYFIEHAKFANAPQRHVRAFMLIQTDLLELFDYVEPADKNLGCYSYRMHELLMRSCIEIEANCKAILSENGYSRAGGHWNMADYKKLEATHRLSSYQVKFPVWHGDQAVRTPFSSWATGDNLTWYDAYNATKHDRHEQFEQANFANVLDAAAGLVALLTSQFGDYDFLGPRIGVLTDDTFKGDGFETAIGNYFRIKYPDWPAEERYEFKWEELQNDPEPFQLLF
jgi:hypothetical protein